MARLTVDRRSRPRFECDRRRKERDGMYVTKEDKNDMNVDDSLDKEFGARGARWKWASDWNHPWKSV